MTAGLLQALAAAGACLTADELVEATGKPYQSVTGDLAAAFQARLISRADRGCYRLTAAGRDALANDRPLPAAAAPPMRGGASWSAPDRQRLWNAMRSLRKFCQADLIALAAVPQQNVRGLRENAATYVLALHRAGYLLQLAGRVQVSARSSLGQKRYRLLRDTGLLSPQVRRGGEVYDRNLGSAVTLGSWP